MLEFLQRPSAMLVDWNVALLVVLVARVVTHWVKWVGAGTMRADGGKCRSKG